MKRSLAEISNFVTQSGNDLREGSRLYFSFMHSSWRQLYNCQSYHTKVTP